MTAITSSHDLLGISSDGTRRATGAFIPGKRSFYCYLFPGLADEGTELAPAPTPSGCFRTTDETTTVQRLKAFADVVRDTATNDDPLLTRLPAAYTYFGQFVNHDISAPIGGLFLDVDKLPPAGIVGTADPVGVGKEIRGDTRTILEHFVNEHAVPLSLSSLYGDGPDCDDDEVTDLYLPDRMRFRLGTAYDSSRDPVDQGKFRDLKINPRDVRHFKGAPDIPRRDYKPLIADRRNDGNLILSQLHLAFMLLHNKAVDALERQFPKPADCFREARQLVTLHYHWVILHDFLPSLMSRSVLADRPLASWTPKLALAGQVPMEFTTAAFRFGHSMVGAAYDFNANFGVAGVVSQGGGASLAELFAFTSRRNMNRPNEPCLQVPDHWVIDWDRMTRPRGTVEDAPFGAEAIDLTFVLGMLNQIGEDGPSKHASIMFRNLMRGFHRRIPFGQRLAAAYGKEFDLPVLTARQVLDAMPEVLRPAAKAAGIDTETPAWLYVLCEAKSLEAGERLGPTASHIIGDTIVGLMAGNPNALLCHDQGRWDPGQSALQGGKPGGLTTLRDVLLFAAPWPGT